MQFKWKYLLQFAVEHFDIIDLFLDFLWLTLLFNILSSDGSFSSISELAIITSSFYYFFSGGY